MPKRSKTARRGRGRTQMRRRTQRRRRTYRRGGGGDVHAVDVGDSTHYGTITRSQHDEYDVKASKDFGGLIVNDQPAVKQYRELKATLGSSKAYEEIRTQIALARINKMNAEADALLAAKTARINKMNAEADALLAAKTHLDKAEVPKAEEQARTQPEEDPLARIDRIATRLISPLVKAEVPKAEVPKAEVGNEAWSRALAEEQAKAPNDSKLVLIDRVNRRLGIQGGKKRTMRKQK